MKFNVKFVVAIMILIAIAIGCILAIIVNNTETLTNSISAAQSQTASRAIVNALADYRDDALDKAGAIASYEDVRRAIQSGDSANLREVLAAHEGRLDFITVSDAKGIVIARSYSDKFGDDITNQKVISSAISTGTGISAIEKGTQIPLAVRASATIKDDSGKLLAVLSCGYDLSNPEHVDKIKDQSNCEVTLFSEDTRLSTTIKDESGQRVIGTKASEQVIQTVLQDRQNYTGRITLFGKRYEVFYTPLIVDDQVLGMLFSGVDIENTLVQESNMAVLVVIAAVLLLLAVLVTAVLIRWTTKKIHWYESLLDAVPFPLSVTDMNMNWTFINSPVEQMLGVKRSDMLGKPCSSWGAAICNTDNCGINCLRNNKNTTFFSQMGMEFEVDINYIHDARGREIGHIEIVKDISEMVKTQKAQTELVGKISNVSHTFVTGSKRIADGAQALAQGSTEQAAVIQELAASVSEIESKTRENAEMAGRAASLADTIKKNAEKGNIQMGQMTAAVREINEASQSVNRVIKVIDDIAFQTNILALNAAVEAARAGQHGKGFAVVAEEVRNLAAKSAEAAKDTGGLIVNSMEKAELGAKIADETAASLAEIVSGINESSKIISDIARSSDMQSHDITEINRGIDQVAQVIAQNSATAEESAAASQEISGESNILEDLVTRFESK